MNSKWFIAISVILLVFLILYFLGKKSVHHEITINASTEKVWSVLINMEVYDEWNPTMKLVDGLVIEDGNVVYQFTQDTDNISEIPAVVKRIIPNKLLNQTGGMPIILTFDHKYILEAQGNKTKVIIHEDYKGVGVNFWNPKPVEEAYGRLNKALKKRVESLN